MALYLGQVTVPEPLMVPINYLADLNTPLPMLVVGYQLSHANFKAALQGISSWVTLVLRLLVLLAAAMTGCLLSSLCRTVNVAVGVCCAGLVGPAALELVGVRAAGILSLARLWTPVTCSLYVYLIPLALLVVCPLLCVRRRPRV